MQIGSNPSLKTSPTPVTAARAADGDYKTKGIGHEIKDADGDYKPQQVKAASSFSASGSTLDALSNLKKGG